MTKAITLILPLFIVICFGCSRIKKVIKLNSNCCDEFAHSFEEGILMAPSLEKTMLIVILSKQDLKYYDDHSCALFNFTKKKDKTYLEIVHRDFSIVKLELASFEAHIHDSLFSYQGAKDFVKEALQKDSSFIFISSAGSPSVYGTAYLNDTEGVKDLMWVQFGP